MPRVSSSEDLRTSLVSIILPVTMALRTTYRLAITIPRRSKCLSARRPYATSDRSSDRVATNDPSPPPPVQNVSDTNATPISPHGIRDSKNALQELPEAGEARRVVQAPNRATPWSRSQQPRERAMSGPRFEQTIMEYQVRVSNQSEISEPETECMLLFRALLD